VSNTDFDLHGHVGIRLVDAGPAEVEAVTKQLGPIQTDLDREPDIVVRFVDRLPLSSKVRYLGVDDTGFTNDAFLVLRGKHKSPARVQIPFGSIGRGCEILCERGVIQVPLLVPIVNLTALGKGILPLHASAFNFRDTGVVATGWSKGGKTETLLSFMSNGATYVGDEWIYFSADGNTVHGIPEPIRIWNWQLEQLPEYRGLVSKGQRTKLQALGLMVDLTERIAGNGKSSQTGTRRMAHRVRAFLGKQLHVDISPHRLFGNERCATTGVIDEIVFVSSHEQSETTLAPLDPTELARRMVFSLQEEQQTLLSYYWKFRFAFPETVNDLLENSRALQLEILERVLAGKSCHELTHPYPMRIASLFEKIEQLCGEPSRSSIRPSREHEET
jgi:hypothetical protein